MNVSTLTISSFKVQEENLKFEEKGEALEIESAAF